jgi:hypothetical protein
MQISTDQLNLINLYSSSIFKKHPELEKASEKIIKYFSDNPEFLYDQNAHLPTLSPQKINFPINYAYYIVIKKSRSWEDIAEKMEELAKIDSYKEWAPDWLKKVKEIKEYEDSIQGEKVSTEICFDFLHMQNPNEIEQKIKEFKEIIECKSKELQANPEDQGFKFIHSFLDQWDELVTSLRWSREESKNEEEIKSNENPSTLLVRIGHCKSCFFTLIDSKSALSLYQDQSIKGIMQVAIINGKEKKTSENNLSFITPTQLSCESIKREENKTDNTKDKLNKTEDILLSKDIEEWVECIISYLNSILPLEKKPEDIKTGKNPSFMSDLKYFVIKFMSGVKHLDNSLK